MPTAETTHPIEWRDDGYGGQMAWCAEDMVGAAWPAIWDSPDGAWLASFNSGEDQPPKLFYTASAARSFVEKSVKEAGHGE